MTHAQKRTMRGPLSLSPSRFNLEETGTFVTSLIYYKRHFELSTGDVIMNIAVSFSLLFAENMLNMS